MQHLGHGRQPKAVTILFIHLALLLPIQTDIVNDIILFIYYD